MVEFRGKLILAPLTKGGNLPYRRLCAEFGADITVSEMAYAREILRRNKRELALLRRHPSERCFGVQLAADKPEEAVRAAEVAVERGADFIDLNCGCPIHEVTRRGLGAALLERRKRIADMVTALVHALPVPITVKLRSGWSEGDIVALKVAQAAADAGAAAVTLHARTREQRYSRAADWELIAELARELPIPVIGNGDLLTHFEAAEKQRASNCAAVMFGRGALIKPWIFKECLEHRAAPLSPRERYEIFGRLTEYMREHFRDDERGKRRAMEFLPWHLDFLARYRPSAEQELDGRTAEHPLIQTRTGPLETNDPLERLLASSEPADHAALAEALWQRVPADELPAWIDDFRSREQSALPAARDISDVVAG